VSTPFNPQTSATINSVTVVPVAYTSDGKILLAFGTTVPTDGSAGFAHMCLFVDTDASGTAGLLANIGTSSSCDFNAVTVAS
jgi:hypothetical protein